MTTLTATRTHTSGRSIAALGAGTFLATMAGIFVGAHDWLEIAVMAVLVAIACVLVFGLVVPRALRKESAPVAALALSVPALLLVVPAFWAGLPFVLGIAGTIVGSAGRRAPKGAAACIVAMVLGALASLAYIAIYVSDVTAGGAGFLFD
jgi:hypothetical protein